MSLPPSLAVVVTHPVQYLSPLFRELAKQVDLTTYYAHRPTPREQGHGFGVAFEWDIDLTSGYHHVWLNNRSAAPSAATFRGCDTPEIVSLLRRTKPDAVLVAGWHSLAYWQAIWGAWAARIPLLVRGDSQLAGDRPALVSTAKELLYPMFIRRFAACLAVGIRSEAYFRHYGASRIVRSPHFVDNGFFSARAGSYDPAQIRRDLGIRPGAVVALFAGKLTPMKRPLDLVRAAAGVDGIHLVIAGDGELRGDMEALTRTLDVPATFLGFMNQTEIPRAYAAADLLVLPSDARETWGLVVNEAMASGLPAVVSDAVGCGLDLVSQRVTGFHYPLGNTAALGAILRSIADRPDQLNAMGEAARARVAGYNVGAAVAGIMAAFAQVTDAGKR